jgi:hypothetical protein
MFGRLDSMASREWTNLLVPLPLTTPTDRTCICRPLRTIVAKRIGADNKLVRMRNTREWSGRQRSGPTAPTIMLFAVCRPRCIWSVGHRRTAAKPKGRQTQSYCAYLGQNPLDAEAELSAESATVCDPCYPAHPFFSRLFCSVAGKWCAACTSKQAL